MNDNSPTTVLPSSQNANQVPWNSNTTSKVMENKTIVYQSEVMGSLRSEEHTSELQSH
mgnify:CR=1 FL=1